MTWEMNYLFTNVPIIQPFILMGACSVTAPYCQAEVLESSQWKAQWKLLVRRTVNSKAHTHTHIEKHKLDFGK